MGSSKTNLFTHEENRLAMLAKALGHPARIAILRHLLKVQGCICGDLVEVLPLSQSTISQHLKALKEAGVIKGEVEGVRTCYCIDEKVWQETRILLNELLKESPNCC